MSDPISITALPEGSPFDIDSILLRYFPSEIDMNPKADRTEACGFACLQTLPHTKLPRMVVVLALQAQYAEENR